MPYPFDPRFWARPEISPASEEPLPAEQRQKLHELLAFIWPQANLDVLRQQFMAIIKAARQRLAQEYLTTVPEWSEKTSVFICYGDHLRSHDPQISPLQALATFFREHFQASEFSQLIAHLLPIYASPYKDGGFDIADPFAVNPVMGAWDDVRALRQQAHLAVDFVANHLSIASPWFERYLHDDPVYRDFFIGFDDPAEVVRFEKECLPSIYRPRPHNPLIPVQKPDGSTRWVYMTFSDHQPDVNYQQPFVFLKMLEVLLFYIVQGACLIRLDAIPYLWKEWGTACAHHPKTHALIELFRLASDLVNPSVKLLAESMEPLADSQRYLSTPQAAKAHLAYNFVPCGLIPQTLLTGDAAIFQRQLPRFTPPDKDVNWAVVCGVTHDGSSLNPCRAPQSAPGEAVLTEDQINAIAAYYTEHGVRELTNRAALAPDQPGALPPDYARSFLATHHEPPRFVNYKTVTDAQGQPQKIVYEAISTYSSLFDQRPEKILAALSMALALPGIPFIYLTLPFALPNDFRYYLHTGNPRELNRGRVILEDLEQTLADRQTLTHAVFSRFVDLLRLRGAHPAFHPDGAIEPVATDNTALLAFLRESPDLTRRALILQNVSSSSQRAHIHLPARLAALTTGYDLIARHARTMAHPSFGLEMEPFSVQWIDLA